nr:hypothetical protein Q903MT_gene2260 [Picea sitchensis]
MLTEPFSLCQTHLVGSGILFTYLIIDILLDSGAQPKAEGLLLIGCAVVSVHGWFDRSVRPCKFLVRPAEHDTPAGIYPWTVNHQSSHSLFKPASERSPPSKRNLSIGAGEPSQPQNSNIISDSGSRLSMK